jgi:hypothetical protein
VALTPDQELARLAKLMDQRADRLKLLHSYIDGNAPLPEGAQGLRDAYAAFQKKARTNLGELVIEAVTERMLVSGFTVIPKGAKSENAEAPADADDDQCRRIYMRNRLAIGLSDVLRDMIGLSAGYMIVSEDPDNTGEALITCERPEQVITDQSASRPDLVRSGMKVYRDFVEETDYAFVHTMGKVSRYKRPFKGKAAIARVQGGWEFIDTQDTGLKFIPIFPYLNRGGIGEFESHTDVLDRINWGILQRLVITAMQAYKQRAVTGDMPSTDEDNNDINYDEMFKPGPGALWRLPEGVTIWESSQTDITAILMAVKDDIRDLAAVTRTPMSMLVPDAANQSAEGARATEKGLIFKTKERITRASDVLSRVMEAALAIENKTEKFDGNVEVLWEDPERQSLTERADAAVKLRGIVPLRTLLTDVLGFSADRVDKMESQLAADSLKEWIMNPAPVAGAATPAPASGDNPAPAEGAAPTAKSSPVQPMM